MTLINDADTAGDDLDAWKASNRAGANAGMVWGVAIVALMLTVAFLVVLSSRPQYDRAQVIGLMIPAVLGVVSTLAVLAGIAVRHGLAYRFGIVFGPIGAAWVLLGSLFILRYLGTSGIALMLAIVALGIATPILWTRSGVKKYFGLCCPGCGGFKIGADSMTFSERRCAACNTVFRADGRILAWGEEHAPAMERPWSAQPESLGVAVQPVAAVPPTNPGPLGGVAVLGYAGLHRGLGAGPPGVERSVVWYIICAAIVSFMSLVAPFAELGQLQQTGMGPPGAPTPEPPLLIGISILHIVGVVVLLIYWLVWVGLIHGEMRRFSGYEYRISPAKAVGFCFIPFFNLYWVVYMPYELARTLPRYLGNKQGSDRSVSVLVFQLLALISGFCLPGLRCLFVGLAMHAIQSVLNDLWHTARTDAPVEPKPEPAPDSTWESSPPGVPAMAMAQIAPLPAAVPAYAPPLEENTTMRMLLPVGRSGWAIAAGYLGLLSPLVVPAPFALATAIMAIRDMRRHPEKHGMGRAIFGLVLGGIVTLIAIVGTASVILEELG